ncbi:hypothetical protein MMC34_006812 [Xylographa carneopallida]|nr:hypothetical protein [Xylographa carneopallida]
MYIPQFSYGLSRPYPYKWFPWAVLLGGLVAVALFSVLNFAANGYDLGAQSTTDPNGTEAQTSWTAAPIFALLHRVGPSCQPQDIPVNTEFYTSKLSRPYTLTNIWRRTAGDAPVAVLPSLAYKNNTLENCSVGLVQVDLESTQRTAMQQGYTEWGAKATALATCSVANGAEPTSFNLTTSYEFVGPLIGTGQTDSFLQLDNQSRASLWWGQSLLSWYWLNLVSATAYANNAEQSPYNYPLSQATLTFQSTNISDLNSLDFFHVGWHFLLSDGTFILTNSYNLSTAAASSTWPNIWTPAAAFAKVFYSVILADLGEAHGGNILDDPALLQSYTDFHNLTNNASAVETPWLQAGPARASYDELAPSLGPLAITPSTIYAQYFCQVPVVKAGGTLFVTILVADLVFVQALWHILHWATTAWLERHDKQANYCPGCLETDMKEASGDMVAARLLDKNGDARWPREKAVRYSEEELGHAVPSSEGAI